MGISRANALRSVPCTIDPRRPTQHPCVLDAVPVLEAKYLAEH